MGTGFEIHTKKLVPVLAEMPDCTGDDGKGFLTAPTHFPAVNPGIRELLEFANRTITMPMG